MTQRLIDVIGPSGAGKDSVLQRLCDDWQGMPAAHWARRTITRAAQAGAFAMAWQANGLRYGIRSSELAPLATGQQVFVNGSRARLPQVLRCWPGATVVEVSAPAELLRARFASDAADRG